MAQENEILVELKNEVLTPTGGKLKEVIIRKPKVKDLKLLDLSKQNIEQGIMLIHALSVPQLSIATIEGMEIEDFVILQEVIAGFFTQEKEAR